MEIDGGLAIVIFDDTFVFYVHTSILLQLELSHCNIHYYFLIRSGGFLKKSKEFVHKLFDI